MAFRVARSGALAHERLDALGTRACWLRQCNSGQGSARPENDAQQPMYDEASGCCKPVSYTHLTLPTICSV
eukprot:151859-Alexandrium_andersonii.AAC.1